MLVVVRMIVVVLVVVRVIVVVQVIVVVFVVVRVIVGHRAASLAAARWPLRSADGGRLAPYLGAAGVERDDRGRADPVLQVRPLEAIAERLEAVRADTRLLQLHRPPRAVRQED